MPQVKLEVATRFLLARKLISWNWKKIAFEFPISENKFTLYIFRKLRSDSECFIFGVVVTQYLWEMVLLIKVIQATSNMALRVSSFIKSEKCCVSVKVVIRDSRQWWSICIWCAGIYTSSIWPSEMVSGSSNQSDKQIIDSAHISASLPSPHTFGASSIWRRP